MQRLIKIITARMALDFLSLIIINNFPFDLINQLYTDYIYLTIAFYDILIIVLFEL